MADEIVVVGHVRTPVGGFGGGFRDVNVAELGTAALRALLERVPGVDPAEIGEVIFGNVENRSTELCLSRWISLTAGLPLTTTAYNVNRLCGSGMQAIHLAAQSLLLSNAEVCVAGGVENMSQYRYALSQARFGYRMGDGIMADTLTEILHHPTTREHGAASAEKIAARCSITRFDQDEFALRSHEKAKAAHAAGYLRAEIVPVSVLGTRGSIQTVEADEGLAMETSSERLARLKPIMPGGTVTAGNACSISDGASAMLLMTRRKAESVGLTPHASIVSMAVTGVDPDYFGLAPVTAIQTALQRAGLAIHQVGLVEINEAFAAQVLGCQKQLDLDPEKLNVNGGAIAVGHALGNSGVRISIGLLSEMRRRGVQYGVSSLCIGLGMGIATVWRLE